MTQSGGAQVWAVPEATKPLPDGDGEMTEAMTCASATGRKPLLTFTVQAWDAWSGAADSPGATGHGQCHHAAPVPVLLRRRIGTLGQHALRLAWGMACSAEARLIASSRHGEFHRALAMLETIVAREDVSPAEFSLAVHHALVGLLSIARGNRRGHTAVAAGPESFCFGFLEAVSCLAETPAVPVLLMHYDEPLPAPFAGCCGAETAPLALVVALTASGPGQPMALDITPATADRPADDRTPAACFRDFLADPLARGLTAAGPRMTWQWTRCAAPD